MKLIWYPAVSIDGFIADSAGSSDFITPEDERQFAKLVNTAGALVVGHTTYQQYHQPTNPFPKVRTYVLTTNPGLTSDNPAVVYLSGGPMEVMRRLHADGYIQAVLSGGGQINSLFAAGGFIDEAWVSLYPLTLGAGTSLFGDHPVQLRLSLRDSLRLPGGIIHSRYEVN